MSQVAKNIITIILGVLLFAAVAFSFITVQEKSNISKVKTSLENQLEEYRQREKTNLSENKDLKDKLVKLETEKNELVERVNNTGGNLDELNAKIRDLTSERDSLKQRIDVLQSERNDLATKIQSKSTASENEQEGTEAAAKLHSGDDEDYWAKIIKEKTALQMELDKTKEELDKTALEVSNLKKQNSDLELEISKLNKDQEAIAREIKYGNDLAKNLSIELARSQNEKQFLSDRMSKINEENNSLHQQLKSLTATKIALEKSIVRLQGDKKQVEGKLLETEGVISSRIDQIYQLKDSLEKEFQPSVKNPKTGEIELSPIIVNNTAKGASEVKAPPAGQQGNIVSINEDNNFVIVNLGEDQGVAVGDKLNVYRGAEFIAGLEVIQVRKDILAADIKNKMMKIEVGDIVR